jgi:glutamine synthetase
MTAATAVTLTFPSSTAGPYFLLATAVAGLVRGIEDRLSLPSGTDSVLPLPGRRSQAAKLLAASPRALGALGAQTLQQLTSRASSANGDDHASGGQP